MWLEEQGEVRKKKKVRVELAGSVKGRGREQSKGENQSILFEVQSSSQLRIQLLVLSFCFWEEITREG